MSDMAEIKQLVEGINKPLVELRKEVEEVKASQKDVLTQDKWDKMSAEITGNMEKIQQKQAKLEAAMSRPSADQAAEEAEESKKKFSDFLSKGIDFAGNERPNDKMQIEVKTMSTDVAPDGGYLVRPEFVSKTVTRVFETSPMRQVADVINGSAKSIELVIDDDEAEVNRVGEGASSGLTGAPEVGTKVIAAHKYDATPQITTEMAADAFLDVESWLSGKVSRKISRSENTDFILGNGVNRARGILTFDPWSSEGVYERGKVEQVNMGAAAALTADGLLNVQGSLIEDYQANASWLMHRTTFTKALQQKGADNYFFSPVLLRDGQANLQLLGKPVVFMNDMPVVAADALSVAYGDFSLAYTIYDREGIIVLRDPYSSHGFIQFYTTKRTGGDVTSYDAFKIGKVAA